jgi:hypothetical protein
VAAGVVLQVKVIRRRAELTVEQIRDLRGLSVEGLLSEISQQVHASPLVVEP